MGVASSRMGMLVAMGLGAFAAFVGVLMLFIVHVLVRVVARFVLMAGLAGILRRPERTRRQRGQDGDASKQCERRRHAEPSTQRPCQWIADQPAGV